MRLLKMVAHFYNLPFQGGTGIDAVISDAQAGYERALQVLTCALGGVNFIHLSIGMTEQTLLASYEQCVIDNEILGAAFQITKGIEVNKETIALDIIKEVGPGVIYDGHSTIVDCFGKTLAYAAEEGKNQVLFAELSNDRLLEARSSDTVFRDRRPELYGMLSQPY